jgi:hypothetical protein
MSDIGATSYQGSAATTPSNTSNDAAGPFAAFIIEAAGTVSIVMTDGSTRAFGAASFTAGPTIYPFQFKRVNSTGTTATVVGLYAMPLKAPFNPGAGPGGAP